MSLIASLRNVASATRLKEGSLEDLVKRIETMKKDMSDIDQGKLDTKVSDAFTAVSAILDRIELDQAESVVNRLRGNASNGFKAPAADSSRGDVRNGFMPPKAV